LSILVFSPIVGVAEGAPVDAAVGADRHPVLQDDPSQLRHVDQALGADRSPEPGLADHRPGQDRTRSPIRAKPITALPEISQSRPMATPGPITVPGADPGPAADPGARADHHAGGELDVVLDRASACDRARAPSCRRGRCSRRAAAA
jgi:hypothetical protein